MNIINNKYEEKGYGLVKIPTFSDSRGCLSIADEERLPFIPKRVFWIYDVVDGKTRGGHAHNECAEVVFAVKGRFEMFVDNGKEQQTFTIDSPDTGIYIGKNVWCELRNFAPGTVCVALASHQYNANGYINCKDEFDKIFGR